MLSIITCSRDEALLRQLGDSIARTVGVPYELIGIDNAAGGYGICTAYNEGAARSRYDTLCFLHEDLLFLTPDWGQRVLDWLQDPSIGLIGVAGGTVKTRAPAMWYTHLSAHSRFNVRQHYKDGRVAHDYWNPGQDRISDVVTVDGLWFCCRKAVWRETGFDGRTFPGFHGYDADFSMQVHQKGYRVCVIYDVLVEHLSPGTTGKAWALSAARFAEKWKRHLPASVHPLTPEEAGQVERMNLKRFLRVLHASRYRGAAFVRYGIQYLLRSRHAYNWERLFRNVIRYCFR
ncbi:MAG: glycosyltransferase [Cytophagales bacterium]|nr:glycosyltransferase [Cytophagales bacterium]